MYCNIGILLEKQGKLDEAINEYRKALQVNPEYTKARNLLDVVLAKKKNDQSEKL
jgi:tetratricopeptide (TPR) repeat protein